MIFIDGANLMMACRSFDEDLRINHKKLVELLAGERSVRRAYYYDSFRKPMEDREKRFFETLQFLGLTVDLKPLRELDEGGFVQRGVHMALAIEALSMAYRDAYDTLILVSGDDDYTQMVKHIKRLGKRVEVAFFLSSTSKALKLKCDRLQILDDFAYEFELEKRDG